MLDRTNGTGMTSGAVRKPVRHGLAVLAMTAALGIHGCSTSSNGGPPPPPPCETTFAGQCGSSCASDAQCPSGLYCGADGSCTSDCSATSPCPDGFACSVNGRCETIPSAAVGGGAPTFGDPTGAGGTSGSLTDGGACVSESRRGEGIPLDIFVMWDRSGSMDDEVNGGIKWNLVVSAFQAFLTDPGSEGISVGLQYFPLDLNGNPVTQSQGGGRRGPNDANTSCNEAHYAAASVPIAPLPGNAAAISSSLAALAPAGRTPTRVALGGAIQHAQQWAAQHPERTVIVVLQTDGQPNVCDSTVDAVAQVAAAGFSGVPSIPTYVIGVGSELGNLNTIAQAGGTGQAIVVDTTQDTSAQFLAALNAIRGDAQIPCEYRLPDSTATQIIDPERVNVSFVSGTGITTDLRQAASPAECDAASGGWYYDDPTVPTRIQLCDSTCNAVISDPDGQIDVLLGCTTIPIVPR